MMAKLANGERIHAVFEFLGQFAHDVVPGAFIALKAGATLWGETLDETTGRIKPIEIDETELARWLVQPCKKHRYVVGATKEIAQALAEHLALGQ